MSNESYTSQLEAPSSPEVVHQALTKELPLWWTQKVEAGGDTFTVFFGETHKTFSVEIEPYTTGSFHWFGTAQTPIFCIPKFQIQQNGSVLISFGTSVKRV